MKQLTWQPMERSSWRALSQRAMMWAFFVGVLLLGMPGGVQAGSAYQADPVRQRSMGCRGVYHAVRPGQTLASVAAAYGSTAIRIMRCNGLQSYTIYSGQRLLVPTARP